MPHKNAKGPHNAVSESELKVKYTKTYEWLKHFKDILLETRLRNGKFFDEEKDPFYALDNVGTYTFSPYKVVWREQKGEMTSCVISQKKDKTLKGKLIIPDSKVLFCPLKSKEEAYYLCAVLNSLPVRYVIENYTIETQRGTDILKNIKMPKFSLEEKDHKRLVELSIKAHDAFSDKYEISKIEGDIDNIVCDMFGVDREKIDKFYSGS